MCGKKYSVYPFLDRRLPSYPREKKARSPLALLRLAPSRPRRPMLLLGRATALRVAMLLLGAATALRVHAPPTMTATVGASTQASTALSVAQVGTSWLLRKARPRLYASKSSDHDL